ncbi:ABC transporter permease [Acuticoccus mangrovi]|uniref:ABC transporter permease n=1 Tax=Acuticoccus mangrovi TaxID=2796142 RepID=A0A934MH99_9HYPH|nr:ABC transporter permease [Acuticoccus mangrovi]MBJ3776725.1 ABC transporter permease [Acuticoccus mangrovi]
MAKAHRTSLLITHAAMLLPLLVILGFFFVLPLGIVATTSLKEEQTFPSLAQYLSIFTDGFYLEVMVRTLVIGLVTTVAALLAGYPAALLLVFSSSRWRRVFLFIIISPLFVSVIVRTYGWIVLLGPTGPIASLFPPDIRPRMLKTEGAIVIGLMHIYIPYMVLSINSAMAKIDVRLLRAAATLRASRWQIFKDIILPLSAPGVVAGSAIVFSLSMTAFSTPVLLGGARNKTMPFLIYQENLVLGDWQSGSALAIVLLAITTTVLAVVTIASSRIVNKVGG